MKEAAEPSPGWSYHPSSITQNALEFQAARFGVSSSGSEAGFDWQDHVPLDKHSVKIIPREPSRCAAGLVELRDRPELA